MAPSSTSPPSSPTPTCSAKHTAELTARQRERTELIGNHDQLNKKVDDLAVALKLQQKNALKIESACTGITSSIRGCLLTCWLR
jgi:hypothetical protein